MIRKRIYAIVLGAFALAALGVGSALAQGQQPPLGGMRMGPGMGWMHDLVEKALAAKLGLPEKQVEDAFGAGKSMYQIAQDAGIADADIPAILTAVHEEALQNAVKTGYVTQAQADLMLQRMQGAGFNAVPGNCPMGNGGRLPNSRPGFRGGMMGNW